MKKEWIRNFVALAVLGGLVFYVSFQRKKNFETSEKTDQEKKLIQLDWAPIDRMEIKNVIGKVTFFKRPKDEKGNYVDSFSSLSEEFDSVSEWMISEPIQALPEVSLLKTLLDNVKDVTSTKVVDENGSTPEQYQLKEPSIEIGLFEKGKPSPKFTLKVGDTNSASTGFYAQTSESPKIHLIGMTLDYVKTRKPSDWRTKEIIGFKDVKSVQKIEFQDLEKKESLLLVREGENWKIAKPTLLPADSKLVDNFLTGLGMTKGNEVVSDAADQDQATYNFQKPIAKVIFTTGVPEAKKGKTLLFSKNGKNEFFVRREGGSQIFSIPENIKTTFLKKIDQVINKKPFSGDESKISKIEIQKGKEHFQLEKTGEQWGLKKPVIDQVDSNEIHSLVSRLSGLSARAFIPLLKEGEIKLGAVKLNSGEEEKRIIFYSDKSGKKTTGILSDPKMSFEFEKGDIDFIINSAENLREKRLMSLETNDLSSFKIKKGAVELQVQRNLKKDKGVEWKVSSLSGGDAGLKKKLESKEILERIVRNIEGLKIQSFLNEPIPQKEGVLLIELHPENGNLQAWSVDSGSEGRYKVWSLPRKVVGEVSGNDIEALQNLFTLEKTKG